MPKPVPCLLFLQKTFLEAEVEARLDNLKLERVMPKVRQVDWRVLTDSGRLGSVRYALRLQSIILVFFVNCQRGREC